MLLQSLLPCGKCRWRRWWSCSRNHLAACNGSWWSGNTVGGVRMHAKDRLRRWRYCRSGSYGRARQLARIDCDRITCDRLRAGKRLLRDRSDSSAHIAVHVCDVIDGGVVIDDRSVVNICDRRCVHSGVRDVHAIHIRRAYAIRRYIDFARTKREPGYRPHSHSADERDQSRSIHGTFCHRSRNPSPAPIYICPAPIVEGCISPRRIVHPSPPPRINPCPVAVMVGCPSRLDMWEPDIPVGGIRAPVSVIIEIGKPNYLS